MKDSTQRLVEATDVSVESEYQNYSHKLNDDNPTEIASITDDDILDPYAEEVFLSPKKSERENCTSRSAL